MKKLSKIVESLWSDLQDRSSGDVIRQEDAFNPEYIDFGENTTVYWMTENLIIDNASRFLFDDIKDYNNNGWRLPTVEEVKQLNWDGTRIIWSGRKNIFRFPDGNEITLNFCNETPGTRLWTKDVYDKSSTAIWGYGLDIANKFTLDPFNRSFNKLLVVLVKDKKLVNESLWSDLQDRSSGDVVRKEDEHTNLKELVPVDMGVNVLWADKDLEYKNENDASYFTYEEVEDIIKKSEWRIPTKDEYIELFKYTKEIKNTDNVFITEGDFDDAPQLIFNKKGYMYGDNSDTISYISHYCAWTSTPRDPEGYYMVDINHLPVPGYFPMHYLNKGCIRLVKDRK